MYVFTYFVNFKANKPIFLNFKIFLDVSVIFSKNKVFRKQLFDNKLLADVYIYIKSFAQ